MKLDVHIDASAFASVQAAQAEVTRLQKAGRPEAALSLLQTQLRAMDATGWDQVTQSQVRGVLRLLDNAIRLELRCGTVPAARKMLDRHAAIAQQQGVAVPPWTEISLLFAEGRIDEAWALARTAQIGTAAAPTPPVRRIMARLAIEAGEAGIAEQMMRDHLEALPEDVAASNLFFEAISLDDMARLPEEALDRLREGKATAAQIRALDVYWRHGDLETDDILRIYLEALERFPEDAPLARLADRRRLSDSQKFLRGNSVGAQLNDMKGHLRSRLGFDDLAEARLLRIEALREDDLARPVISSAKGSGVSTSPDVEGGDVLIRFDGLVDAGVPFFLDIMAAAAGLNVLYLRDKQRLFYCNGIAELGADLPATISALRSRVAAYGEGRKVTTFGASAGGWGAILYGLLLGADRVVALSAPVTAMRTVSQNLDDYRARALLGRLERHVPAEFRDLDLQYANAAKVPQVDYIYGAENKIDAAHAALIAKHPNVTLYPLAGVETHNTIGLLSGMGLLPALMKGDMSPLEGLAPR